MESILYVGIITKSVSRFARNVEDFLSSVRTLAEHNPPVGVYFQTEAIYSLQSDSSMALTVQATMAENESRNKSRSIPCPGAGWTRWIRPGTSSRPGARSRGKSTDREPRF